VYSILLLNSVGFMSVRCRRIAASCL